MITIAWPYADSRVRSFLTLLISPATFKITEMLSSRIVVFLEAGAVFGAVEGILGTLEGTSLTFSTEATLG